MSRAKICSRFVATRKSEGASFKFRVQEATTADDKEAVLDFMVKHMTPSEAFAKAAGTAKSKDALKESRKMNGIYYDVSHCMICYEDKEPDDNTENPIIAMSLVSFEEGEEKDLSDIFAKIQTPEMKKFFKIISVLEDLCNERKKLGLDKYYAGWGVCVRPDYAGLGIAKELLSLRRALCKEHDVPATGAWMTAIGSQKAAERDGWKTVFEIFFEELGRLAEVEFYGVPPMCKLMVAFSEK